MQRMSTVFRPTSRIGWTRIGYDAEQPRRRVECGGEVVDPGDERRSLAFALAMGHWARATRSACLSALKRTYRPYDGPSDGRAIG